MTRRRGPSRPLLFTSGYLLVWGVAGMAAYGLFRLGRSLFGADLAWDAGGRWFAGGVLTIAALYELTPLKDVCLAKCRSPLGFLLGTWRDGRAGRPREWVPGTPAWCVGCCWALMAALFALGVMSLAWMALVAALIALREDPSVAPRRDLEHRGRPARPRGRDRCGTPQRPRTRSAGCRSWRHPHHEREADALASGLEGGDLVGQPCRLVVGDEGSAVLDLYEPGVGKRSR